MIEAAIIDGASEGQILRSVILPSMTAVLLTTIICDCRSLTGFDLIFAMTGGGPCPLYGSHRDLYVHQHVQISKVWFPEAQFQ